MTAIGLLTVAVMYGFPFLMLASIGGATIFIILTIPKQITSHHIRTYLHPYVIGVLVLSSGWMYFNDFPVIAVLMVISAGVFLLARTNRLTPRQLHSFSGSMLILVGAWLLYIDEVLKGLITIIMTVIVFGRLIKETVVNLRH